MTKKVTKSRLYFITTTDRPRGLRISNGKVSIYIPRGPENGAKWKPHQWKAYYKVRDAFHPWDTFGG